MMLNGGAKTRQAEQERQSAENEHEAAVKRVYSYERITLAIARMSYYDAYTGRKDILGEPSKNLDDFTMYGVVNEPYADAKRIHCEVKFTDYPSEDDFIGSCLLTHLLDEKKQSEDRKLMLAVSVWDAGREWRQKSYNVLRDAAISGNRFCHFRIEAETAEHSDALAQLREKGYGPTIRLREFTMWPTITLPNAPEWGWKEA
jgi:hypothetical protein